MEFDEERDQAILAMDSARDDLLALVGSLSTDHLSAGRRGGWTVAQVLDHVIVSELHYAAGIHRLRGDEAPRPAPRPPVGSRESAVTELAASRASVLAALDGVDEDAFYRLDTVMGQEYSILSIIENIELHDREHEAQIRTLSTVSK